MIGLENAGVRRGRWIFSDVSFAVEPGQTLAVLGPNGRGKTTLIKALAGLVPLAAGRRIAPPLIGYVSQAIGSDISYRALDVVVMGRALRLGLFGAPGAADYRAALDALEQVGAAQFAERPFDRLSGGERQIVLLARALATGSSALVLDEPASALDLANQNRLLAVLRDLKTAGRHAILFSTHLPQHALSVADDALLMMDAASHVVGPVRTVLDETNLTALYGLPVRRLSLSSDSGGTIEAVVPMFGGVYA
ncbi:ABC transporter ATP-binding protein [Methylocystis sp. Sn-Cys]|uniref:ABC transporter ATP-binding protein n=1 Tax=Methylocystis sp. Sn-Cys TaxID=1701263 RepID=UPI001922F0E6|nr:ABC transporter ATP-binding protein [Methylocystis sp. Sn-Cys]MBL1257721.1 ABC transporter ATP-binding protein [Methylocystis sp. Sn-Cys]